MKEVTYGTLPKDHVLRQCEHFEYEPITKQRWLKGFKVGNYYFSVQASSGHYCTPKETLKDLSMYQRIEVFIMKNSDRSALNWKKSSVFRKFPRYQELIDGCYSQPFGWMPVALLNDLYHYLKSRS